MTKRQSEQVKLRLLSYPDTASTTTSPMAPEMLSGDVGHEFGLQNGRQVGYISRGARQSIEAHCQSSSHGTLRLDETLCAQKMRI